MNSNLSLYSYTNLSSKVTRLLPKAYHWLWDGLAFSSLSPPGVETAFPTISIHLDISRGRGKKIMLFWLLSNS